MIYCILDGDKIYPSLSSNIKITRENPDLKDKGSYTLDVTFPMDIFENRKKFRNLNRIDVSELDPRLKECEITVACDVTNPLCGHNGASAVYGPQKGAGPQTVRELDRALVRYAAVLARDLGCDVADVSGSGAAGGLGAGLLAFCGAQIRSGIDSVLDAVRFETLLDGSDLVITGEGAVDRQTVFGKVPAGVAARAKAALPHIPVIAVAGTLGKGYEEAHGCGIDFMTSIATGPISLEECMSDAPRLLTETGCRLAHLTHILA